MAAGLTPYSENRTKPTATDITSEAILYIHLFLINLVKIEERKSNAIPTRIVNEYIKYILHLFTSIIDGSLTYEEININPVNNTPRATVTYWFPISES